MTAVSRIVPPQHARIALPIVCSARSDARDAPSLEVSDPRRAVRLIDYAGSASVSRERWNEDEPSDARHD